MEGSARREGGSQCSAAPEKNDEKRYGERETEQFFTFEKEGDGAEQGDADTQQLGERKRNIEESKSEILGGVVEGHTDNDKQ